LLPVYVNVNAHVFVDTNCNGEVQLLGTSQANTYAWVENYINQCNYALENNPIHWGSNEPAACMPFHWVLRGVYMPCKSNSIQNDALNNLVNGATEINAFFTDCLGGCTGQSLGKYIILEGLGTGVFNHEMGHEFF